MSSLTLDTGRYIIVLQAAPGAPLPVPAPRFRGCIAGDGTGNPDLTITIHRGVPPSTTKMKRVLSSPFYQQQGKGIVKRGEELWSLYTGNGTIMIKSLVPDLSGSGSGGVTAYLLLSLTSRQWNLFIDTPEREVDPLAWPVDGLVLYYLATMAGDILIHASAVEYGGNGYLFTGSSGSGKTTMAKIWEQRGARVIHDDRVIVSPRGVEGDGCCTIFSTPVYDNDEPRNAPLHRIFLIGHGSGNSSVPLRGAAAVTAVMANCIQHNWSGKLIESLTEALSLVTADTVTSKLLFLPDITVTDYILSHENQKT